MEGRDRNRRLAAMLDFIILFVVARKLGAKVRAKGHEALPYQVLLIVLWLVGEVLGAIGGSICAEVICYRGGHLHLVVACALAGAIFGATIVFSIADGLSDLSQINGAYEAYEEERHFDPAPLGEYCRDERYRRLR